MPEIRRLDTDVAGATLDELRQQAADCTNCTLYGPSGRLLDSALVDAGIDRDTVYVTNAVKHFKFTSRGKRRIHAKPNAEEIAACRHWLDASALLRLPSQSKPAAITEFTDDLRVAAALLD